MSLVGNLFLNNSKNKKDDDIKIIKYHVSSNYNLLFLLTLFSGVEVKYSLHMDS